MWASSRLLYLAAGAVFASVLPPGIQPVPPDGNIWGNWDGSWYTGVARGGYPPGSPESTAFFPLYPALMRGATELFGGPVAVPALQAWGLVVSLASFLLALFFVYRIAEDGWGTEVARRTVLCLAFFPSAFFFNAVYTESLFLALVAGSVWAYRVRRDLLLASALGALAVLTRHVGILLVLPLAFAWLTDIRRYRWRGAYLALVPSGLIAYAAFLRLRFGDTLVFQKVQKTEWSRTFEPNPLVAVRDAVSQARSGAGWILDPGALFAGGPEALNRSFEAANVFNLAVLLFLVAILVVGPRHLPLDLYLLAFVFTAPLLLYGMPGQALFNLPRLVLAAFPLFIVLGVLLKDRRALGTWLILSGATSLFLCAEFVSWRWVA